MTGVTKAVLGCPQVAATLLNAGVARLGDSRIENIERMRSALGPGPTIMLLRSPMLSQVARIVFSADTSFNTELVVIRALSDAAKKAHRIHGVILMVELGDLREGFMPDALLATVGKVLSLPNIKLKGIGTNLACLSGTTPDTAKMAVLTDLANAIELTFGIDLEIVSGGNSANIDWAFSESDRGRINDLRLGEAILLGRETLSRHPIDGLHLDAFVLVGEVIEVKIKPTRPWGKIAQNAFGETVSVDDRGEMLQAIVAIGRQDCDPIGLDPPAGITIRGASSDHLVLDLGSHCAAVGGEMAFGVDYSTLLRAMTSPFVEKATWVVCASQTEDCIQVPGTP